MWGPAGLNFGAGVVPYLHKLRETSEFVLDVKFDNSSFRSSCFSLNLFIRTRYLFTTL